MDEQWSPYETAEALVNFLPTLGRLLGPQMRNAGEEEMTLIQVLSLKHFQGRPFTVSELAKRRKVSLQSVSVLIQRLVERGWIVRSPDPDDRRQMLLHLTPEGMAQAEATRNQIVSYLAGFLGTLTPEEIAAAQVFLPALQRALQSVPEPTLEEQ